MRFHTFSAVEGFIWPINELIDWYYLNTLLRHSSDLNRLLPNPDLGKILVERCKEN